MRSSLATIPSSLPRLVGGLAVFLLPLFVVGCAGGGTYTVNEGQLAQRFIPTERTVHHPDSLRALTIIEKDRKIRYQLKQDYQALIEKWSSRYQNLGPGPARIQSQTYATFRSLELALVALQPQMGIQSLQKKRAQKLIDKRRKTYFDQIRIDVYWFTGQGMDGLITGPEARTELQIGDRTLRPTRTDHGPLREAYVTGGEVALYRRNTLIFPRMVKGTDVLKNASKVRLQVSRMGYSSEEEFSWRW